MNFIRIFFALFFLVSVQTAYSQKWNWPEDRATAEEKVALYSDDLKLDHFRASADNLMWLLVNAPDLNVSIYQNGAKIYENLAELEENPSRKDMYLDSLMLMYDTRMKYFGDSLNVMNRKVFKLCSVGFYLWIRMKFLATFFGKFRNIFRKKKHIKLGLYGPPNGGRPRPRLISMW